MSLWALAAIAGTVIAYAGFSRALERTPVSAPIFFLSAGLLFGSDGFDWIGLGPTSEQVRLLAELTLTLVLFADASRIDFRGASTRVHRAGAVARYRSTADDPRGLGARRS